MFPPAANIMHDIYGAWYPPEAMRKICADGWITNLREQNAPRQQRRHPTSGQQTRLEPINRNPGGIVLVVAPRREQGGVQQIPVTLIIPLRDGGHVVASLSKQPRDGEPVQLGPPNAGVVSSGCLDDPHGF